MEDTTRDKREKEGWLTLSLPLTPESINKAGEGNFQLNLVQNALRNCLFALKLYRK